MRPELIEGGIFEDERGALSHVNDFDLSKIKRMYVTSNANTSFVRAWMAHKIESRWFFCTQGSPTGFDPRMCMDCNHNKSL